MTHTPAYIAASLVCANMLKLEDEVRRMDAGGVDFIHFDVMDGLFVPRYGLHPEILTALKSMSKTPVDVHMMVEQPELYIDTFAAAGADYYAVHAEACPHLHRTITKIRQAGMKPGVALNPATPISQLQHVIDDIELIVLMAIDPGILGQKLIPWTIEKIRETKALVGDRPDFLIQIDGGVTPETAPIMLEAGANTLVCGTGTIFRPQEAPVDEKIRSLRSLLDTVVAIPA